ncbi:MAG: hypothetical protein H6807_00945 [Planctomycetes bacterium]|nr:hypothetical protein [Planctomycetota bacterium]
MPQKRPTVFIHTNHKQIVGAKVSEYLFRANSKHADRFDIELIYTEDHAFIKERDGQSYLRDGDKATWVYENLQSFTPLRFMPPELMGYEGRAVVVDPDVFALTDVWELFERDMKGKAILCRPRTGSKGSLNCMATSVMLLDCAKLPHWNVKENFAELFDFKRDYMDWICLRTEKPESIGLFENEWNDFDRLTPKTKMIHNTKRQTQPWKTGLPVDFFPARKKAKLAKPQTWLRPIARMLRGDVASGTYKQHPDMAQEAFFFRALKGTLEAGLVTEEMLREEMRKNHVRHDAFEVMERHAGPVAAARG